MCTCESKPANFETALLRLLNEDGQTIYLHWIWTINERTRANIIESWLMRFLDYHNILPHQRPC